MKKLFFLGMLACLISAQSSFAQIDSESSEDEEEIDLQIFVFTSEPRNSDFGFAGESFFVEGDLVAEHLYDGGKSLYFAIQRAEQNDILLTSLSLNAAGEAERVMYVFISKEQSTDLEFGVLTTDESLDVSINYDTFLTETIEQDSAKEVEGKINGMLIRNFKTKNDLENFKKFLKRN